VPSVEQLNLDHLLAGLAAGGLITFVSVWWAGVRAFVPLLLAAAVLVQVDAYLADEITVALGVGAVVLALALGSAAWAMGRRATPALFGLLTLVALVGCWACLPDTEAILTTIGVLAPTILVAWWRVTVTATLLPVLAPVVAWVIALSSVGRPAAAVGAAGCFGLILLVPVVARVDARVWAMVDHRAGPAEMGTVVALQAVLVVICARVAGTSADVIFASSVSAAALIAGGAALVLSPRLLSRAAAPS
jgi:hypothetical protein